MSDVLSTNQAHFSKIAGEYDQRNAPTIVRLEREVQARVPFIGVKPGSRFLDYACGTGMLSRALSKDVGESIGIDLTENMVKMYNAQAQDEGSSALRSAYHGNLADPSDPSPEALSDAKFFSFDLAGVGLGWHHFENCELAAKRLAERLSPGGVFFVVDFASHEMDSAQSKQHGVTHHGFSKEEIKAQFEGAGLGGDFAFEEFAEPVEFKTLHGAGHDGHGEGHGEGHEHGHGHGHGEEQIVKRRVFIARGTKL
ncbi:S-adenosyl-L-methionine-dependent methyltransferase [Thelonectria olida]|uniref:S-adenosyl-L-methionine-dependent methyltransferase n=1 Tax=Thelonectria olida TaxID=1576542 RepID=A0A9P8W1K6_9HYPO|nr:S-adenosyl-L-methionine-dependent methyltransferase [Thelonectria olida]